MSRTLSHGILAAVAVLTLGATAAAQTGRLALKNGWMTDYQTAKAEAKRTGKPIFLVFRCDP